MSDFNASASWDAVEKKGAERNYGTSNEDVKEYGAAAGAAGGVAVCAAYGAAAASPLCAEVGGIVGRAVTGAVLGIGHAIFGGDDTVTPADTWDPVIDKCITAIVREVRTRKKLDVTKPPGGSFRNYPEWKPIAIRWAQHANAVITSHGGTIVWFDGSIDGKYPGHILPSAVDLWNNCRIGAALPPFNPRPYPYCRTATDESPSKYIPEAIVKATHQTMAEELKPRSSGALPIVLAAGAGVGVLMLLARGRA